MSVATNVVKHWIRTQSGFIKWEIHRDTNSDDYTDTVYWESKADAKVAETNMENIPNAADWYACYEEGSVSSKNLDHVATFN